MVDARKHAIVEDDMTQARDKAIVAQRCCLGIKLDRTSCKQAFTVIHASKGNVSWQLGCGGGGGGTVRVQAFRPLAISLSDPKILEYLSLSSLVC